MSKQPSGIEIARELEQIKNQMPLRIQAVAMEAELNYKYYESLIKNGFTEKQALEIVKAKVRGVK